jgi:3D (Asp-Asp-Asp) domain-containing protein
LKKKGEIMSRFLKWGFGIAIVLAITHFLFSQYNNVVEDKSSATLPYSEKVKIESIVIVEQDKNEILRRNSIVNVSVGSVLWYEEYSQLIKAGEYEQLKNTKKRIEYLKSVKIKNDKLIQEKAEKERLRRKKERMKKLTQIPSRGEATHIDSIVFEATAYTPYCYGCSGTTSTGYNVTNTIRYKGMRIIATDRRIVPLYSIVKISYDNTEFYAISMDVGGGIKGYEIDLLVNNEREANTFGRRKVMVEIIRYGQRK